MLCKQWWVVSGDGCESSHFFAFLLSELVDVARDSRSRSREALAPPPDSDPPSDSSLEPELLLSSLSSSSSLRGYGKSEGM